MFIVYGVDYVFKGVVGQGFYLRVVKVVGLMVVGVGFILKCDYVFGYDEVFFVLWWDWYVSCLDLCGVDNYILIC